MPTTDAIAACTKDRPKPRIHAPQEMPRTEMFAANQGMNRSDGLPLRSDSGMTSRPAISTAMAPSPAVTSRAALLMYPPWCWVPAMATFIHSFKLFRIVRDY